MAAKKKTAKKPAAAKKPAVAKKVAAAVEPKPKKEPKARKPRSETPTSGQSGPRLSLEKKSLNGKEEKLVASLAADANPVPINALAAQCFPEEGSKGNSWVRNSLRRLVRGNWVEKVGAGTYRLTDEGRAKNDGTAAPADQTEQAAQPA